MQKSYIPKGSEGSFCDGISLCVVRKSKDGVPQIGIKDLSGNIREEALETIINSDTYNGKEIIRVYSSGHIFFSDDKKEVFLVTTQKDGKIQHQFTGGSPLEEEYKQVVYKNDGVYRFDIEKVRKNARTRTKNRTGVKVIEEYNQSPIVDWLLIENKENEKVYYKLVCLMHFMVKKYEGELSCSLEEDTTCSSWYEVDNLPNIKNVAPNVYIVSKKVIELLSRLNKTIIITDFSKTLTSCKNPTTWSIFAKSGFLGLEYTNSRNRLYKEYHDYELKGNIEKVKEWWSEHLTLFIKYGLTKNLINKVISTEYFTKRQGLKSFLDTVNNKGIELVIVSSGVSEFIRSFLNQNKASEGQIKICGNDIFFNENGKAIGFDNNSIITTLNKDENNFSLELYGKVILLGDDSSDLSMYNGNCVKIGFCDSNKVKGYDIYLGDDGDLRDVLNYI